MPSHPGPRIFVGIGGAVGITAVCWFGGALLLTAAALAPLARPHGHHPTDR